MLFPGVLTRVCVAWQIGVHLTIQTASLPKSLESTPLSCGLQLFVRDTARVRSTAYPIAEVLHIQLLSWRLVCDDQTWALNVCVRCRRNGCCCPHSGWRGAFSA